MRGSLLKSRGLKTPPIGKLLRVSFQPVASRCNADAPRFLPVVRRCSAFLYYPKSIGTVQGFPFRVFHPKCRA